MKTWSFPPIWKKTPLVGGIFFSATVSTTKIGLQWLIYCLSFCYNWPNTSKHPGIQWKKSWLICNCVWYLHPKRHPDFKKKNRNQKKTVNFAKLNLPDSYSPPPNRQTNGIHERHAGKPEISSSPESLHVGVLPSRRCFGGFVAAGCLDFGDHVMGIPISNREIHRTQNGGFPNCHVEFLGGG